MKYQSLFFKNNKRNISKCFLLKFLPNMLSVTLFEIAHAFNETKNNNLAS